MTSSAKKVVLLLIGFKVNKKIIAQPIPPEVKVASTVNLPVVISPMYLAPFQLMQTVAVVLWPTQMLDISGDFQAPKGMRYCPDKTECWHHRRSMDVPRLPRVENRNVTWLVSNSSGFDRAIWREK